MDKPRKQGCRGDGGVYILEGQRVRVGPITGIPVTIYCEHGALTPQIRNLMRRTRIELFHFAYDPDSRSRHFSSIANPSATQIRDLNLQIKDLPCTIADYSGSCHFEEILSILGRTHWRDALHVIQLKSEINGAFPCKRHQKQHLEFCTA
jgi:hypothetical protein